MSGILSFILFVGAIIAAVAFILLKGSLVEEEYFGDISKGPLYFGGVLPVILYFILEGGAKGLDIPISLIIIGVFVTYIFMYNSSLKNNPVTNSGRAISSTIRHKIICMFVLSPITIVVYFVTLVVLIFSLRDFFNKPKGGE